jgi:cell division protein FtsI/penicillin-binding protein 2
LDIRLSIDLQLQRKADDLLGDKSGAIVFLNASSGEILAMVSHPNFDPNTLEENWGEWINDSGSPLVNRAIQSQYPPGTSLAPFLFASAAGQGNLPDPPELLSSNIMGYSRGCLRTPSQVTDWGALISSGCPNPSIVLGQVLGLKGITELYRQIGLDQAPELPLPQAKPNTIPGSMDPFLAALGQAQVRVSPLQMALAAAAISTGGIRPAPLLATAVNIPQQGWVILPSGPSQVSLSETGANQTASILSTDVLSFWQSLGSAISDKGQITWYLAGTTPDWQGSPLALALILEEDDPAGAEKIGSTLMKDTLNP